MNSSVSTSANPQNYAANESAFQDFEEIMDAGVADCVARVRMNDPQAANWLVDHLQPVVAGIVRRKLPRGAAAEDLVQEILAKVFEKLDQYKGEVPLNHWVSRIAVNHCLNAIRSQKARPEWRMADLPEDQEAALDSSSTAGMYVHPAHAMGSREMVEQILAALNPQDSILIRMLDLEEFSIAEVEKATGWSAAYIRLRAFRARKKLHKRFAPLNKKRRRLPTPIC
jgi:RNA polymerase sigma-70 factor (ECF subfamily)